MVDSSPQGGWNWVMMESLFVAAEDLLEVHRVSYHMIALAKKLNDEAQNMDHDDYHEPADLREEVQDVVRLRRLMHRHSHPPVAMGSGRSDLVHELHAMYHAMFLETGHPELLADVLRCGVACTSDRGTEKGLARSPVTKFSEWMPYFQPMELEADGDVDQPADFTLAAPAPPAAPSPPDADLSLQSCLEIHGAYHMTHHIAKGILLAMAHYHEWLHPLLDALADCLNSRWVRERFVSQCLTESVPAAYAYRKQLNSFGVSLVKWRFGSVVSVAKKIYGLKGALKYWDLQKMNFKASASDAGQQPPHHEQPAVPHDPNAPPVIGGEKPKGPNLHKATQAVQAPAFWLWLRMFLRLAEVLGSVEEYFLTCECHRGAAGQERMHAWGRGSADFFSFTCPLAGCRGFSLACEEHREWVDELIDIAASDIYALPEADLCSKEDKARILEDFHSARQHFVYALQLHTQAWQRLPLLLVGVSHPDEDKGRQAYRRSLQQWHLLTVAQKKDAHPLSRSMCAVEGEFYKPFQLWLAGTPAAEVPLVACQRVKLLHVRMLETSIEGRHAAIKKTLQKGSNAGPVAFSLAERLPMMLRQIESRPEVFSLLVACLEDMRHPLKIAYRLGIHGHPSLQSLLNRSMREDGETGIVELLGQPWVHGKDIKSVVYHCDLFAMFLPLKDLTQRFRDELGDTAKAGTLSATIQQTLAFEEFKAMHKIGMYYSIPKAEDYKNTIHGSSKFQAFSRFLERECQANQCDSGDEDVPMDFEQDGEDAAVDSIVTAQLSLPEKTRTAKVHIIQVVDPRLSQKRRSKQDADTESFSYQDLVVVEHYIHDAAKANITLWVDADPASVAVHGKFCGESVAIMKATSLQHARVWQRDRTQDKVALDLPEKPLDLDVPRASVLMQSLLDAGATPGSEKVFNTVGLSDDDKDQMQNLLKYQVVSDEGPNKVRITTKGLSCTRFLHAIAEAGPVVKVDASVPVLERSAASLLARLEKLGWQLHEFKKTSANPEPQLLEVPSPKDIDWNKEMYVTAGRKTISVPYLQVLTLIQEDNTFREQLHSAGFRFMKHLQSDVYYKVFAQRQFLKPAAQQEGDTVFEIDGEAMEGGGTLAASALARPKRKVFRNFTLQESFAWGCVTFYAKKLSHGKMSLQCNCPKRSHLSWKAGGKPLACQFTHSFKTETEQDITIRMMKHWVIQGLSEHKRSKHEELRRNIKKLEPHDLPSMAELDELMPPAARPLTDSEGDDDKPKPKRMKKPRQPRGRGRGRGRGLLARLQELRASRSSSSAAKAQPQPSDTSSSSSSRSSSDDDAEEKKDGAVSSSSSSSSSPSDGDEEMKEGGAQVAAPAEEPERWT